MITNFYKAFIIYLHKNGFVLSLISVVLHPKEGIDCGHQNITIYFSVYLSVSFMAAAEMKCYHHLCFSIFTPALSETGGVPYNILHPVLER